MSPIIGRTALVRVGVVALAGVAALAFTAPANAAKLGGKTILAPEQATFDTLGAAGVTVAPAGPVKANAKGLGFPITGGRVDVDNLSGKIEHKGGLTFSSASASLTLKNFVIKLGDKNVLRASIAGGGKVRLADLDLDKAKVKTRGGKVVVSNVDVLLANRAAKALSSVFHLPNLAGADLGDATVKVKP